MGSWIVGRLAGKLARLTCVGLFYICIAAPVAACSQGAVFLRGEWGTARFNVEIADTNAKRSKGLMFRQSLPQSAGMLFLYEKPAPLAFWMRNTFIELDMLFIGPAGRVRHIHHSAVPHDETPISGGDGMIAVLEINGGLAEKLGITVGSEMRHPFFGKEAAWAC